MADAVSPTVLMCRPTYYTIAYEINPWMSLRRQVNTQRAMVQWNRLYQLLTKRLKVKVHLLPPRPCVPDLVFTANAGLVAGRTFIRSRFRYPQRQWEEPIVERYFTQAGFRVMTLSPRYHFEGEGDALWIGDTLLFGFRFRSDAPAHEELARKLKARVLPIELNDRRFYHLDTCFAPLDAHTALWFPSAFDRYGRKVIERLVADPIAVSEADAKRFACNAVAVSSPTTTTRHTSDRAVIMQTGVSASIQRQLARRRFELFSTDLSEFLKAGGAAKCLVLRLTSERLPT